MRTILYVAQATYSRHSLLVRTMFELANRHSKGPKPNRQSNAAHEDEQINLVDEERQQRSQQAVTNNSNGYAHTNHIHTELGEPYCCREGNVHPVQLTVAHLGSFQSHTVTVTVTQTRHRHRTEACYTTT